MKCIEKAKKYWNENKEGIISGAKILVEAAGIYLIGACVGFVVGVSKTSELISKDECRHELLRKVAADGRDGRDVITLAINRNLDPEFDTLMNQIASTGCLTDTTGNTREVLGAIIYGGDEVKKD